MQTLWTRLVLIASYVSLGAALNVYTDSLDKRSFSTILVSVTPSSATSTPTSSIMLPPVQLARPISQPSCPPHGILAPIPQNLSTTDGSVSPNDLLYRIRQTVCNGSCLAPQGVPSNDVAIAQSGTDYCEISVGVTNTLEAYVYSKTPPVGAEQQECWNSTQSIIQQCVQNQASTGWWNGYVSLAHSFGCSDMTTSNDVELISKQRSCIPILSSRIQASQRWRFDTYVFFIFFHYRILNIDDGDKFFVNISDIKSNANDCITLVSSNDVQRRKQYQRAYCNTVRDEKQQPCTRQQNQIWCRQSFR